jgi:hypothetical protein
MGFVGRRTYVVFRHLARRRRCRRGFVVANDVAVVSYISGLGVVSFHPFPVYPGAYTIGMLLYLFVALALQVLIDYAALIAKRYVPYSFALNVIAGIYGIGGATVCLFGTENISLVHTGSGLLTARTFSAREVCEVRFCGSKSARQRIQPERCAVLGGEDTELALSSSSDQEPIVRRFCKQSADCDSRSVPSIRRGGHPQVGIG